MKHIMMMKGLPGSGKSTLAKKIVSEQPYHARVNKDDLRAMIGNYYQAKEKHILAMRDMIVEYWLEKNHTIIVDDTNFHPKHENRLREIAAKHGAGFSVQWVEATIDECIERDLKRPNSVGEKVIKKMHEEYVRPALLKVIKNDKLPKAVICDLDGTLALHNGRNPYDASTCEEDLVNQPVAEAIWKYGRDDYAILFTSGREDKFRQQTMKFLAKAGMSSYQLFMRATDDKRKDHVVKLELYKKHIDGNYNVEAVFDDRQRVVDMWRDVGLTVFQVADGNF